MTEQTHEDKKKRATKILAVFGLLAILILIAWLSVQIVTSAPNAFSSLASIAEGVYGRSPFTQYEVQVTTSEDVIQTGESTIISWNQSPTAGTYVFSFECMEGVSVTISTSNDEMRGIVCDTSYDIGSITSITLQAESEKDRFIDIPFSIGFLGHSDSIAITTANSVVTVVNATISPVLVNDTTSETVDASEQSPAVTSSDTDPLTQGNNPNSTPGTGTTVETITFTEPVSDPNGWIDLAVSYKGAGYITDSLFVNTGTLKRGEIGAFQFEVLNAGTKTSDDWTYTATLPGGRSYTSAVQDPLRPGERIVISLGAPSPDGTKAEVDVMIALAGDSDLRNNDFTWSVAVTD